MRIQELVNTHLKNIKFEFLVKNQEAQEIKKLVRSSKTKTFEKSGLETPMEIRGSYFRFSTTVIRWSDIL